jgi:hypothetical protein
MWMCQYIEVHRLHYQGEGLDETFKHLLYLTFRGLRIMIYSYNKTNKMH